MLQLVLLDTVTESQHSVSTHDHKRNLQLH